METTLIPIFPLPLVACPSETVPLHIFEHRYRDLIAWCRERQSAGQAAEFGIFLDYQNQVSPVGCAVRLQRVLREHDDGRLDIVVLGQSRCRMLERFHDHSYDSAQIEMVVDDEDDWDEALATRAFTLHRAFILMITGAEPEEESYSGRTSLSFFLAQTAGMMALQKQALLEMRSENSRLELLIRHFEKLINRIKTVQQVVQSVRGSWEIQQALQRRPSTGSD